RGATAAVSEFDAEPRVSVRGFSRGHVLVRVIAEDEFHSAADVDRLSARAGAFDARLYRGAPVVEPVIHAGGATTERPGALRAADGFPPGAGDAPGGSGGELDYDVTLAGERHVGACRHDLLLFSRR